MRNKKDNETEKVNIIKTLIKRMSVFTSGISDEKTQVDRALESSRPMPSNNQKRDPGPAILTKFVKDVLGSNTNPVHPDKDPTKKPSLKP